VPAWPLPRLARSDRTVLLTGTALASTLLLASILGPAPALAVTETIDRERIVQNTDTATNNAKLNTTLSAEVANALFADGLVDFIGLFNLVAIGGAYNQTGNIYLTTEVENTASIMNFGEIDPPIGIESTVVNELFALGNASAVIIVNGANVVGDLTQEANQILSTALLNTAYVNNNANVSADDFGILGEISNSAFVMGNANLSVVVNGVNILGTVTQTSSTDQVAAVINDVTIVNAGDINGAEIGIGAGIFNSDFAMGNANAAFLVQGADIVGDLTQTADSTQTTAFINSITIDNAADIDAGFAGISAVIDNSALLLSAMGNAATSGVVSGFDIDTVLSQSASNTQTSALVNNIDIVNRGDVEAGVAVDALISNDGWVIGNAVNADVVTGNSVFSAHTQTIAFNQANEIANTIAINNQGRAEGGEVGIAAGILNTDLVLGNIATGVLESSGGTDAAQTMTINQTNRLTNNIVVENSGEVRGGEIGVLAEIESVGIEFANIVDVEGINPVAGATQTVNVTQSNIIRSEIAVRNSGSIVGGEIGIAAGILEPTFVETNFTALNLDSPVQDVNVTEGNEVESRIDIFNTGTITADSLLAIDTFGARTTIVNEGAGVITGFVDLTEFNDLFVNQSGGTFQARGESDFGAGFDQFNNWSGGTVHALGSTSFVNLDRFTNSGLISMVNGSTSDVFEISNTAGQTNLAFVAQSGSTLAVDAFLGGPGSNADNFIINGNVTGQTLLKVNNTNRGPGAFNRSIPVVFANGDVKSNAFFLERPIDTGLFEYDLHFVPTNSGFFELRSHPGGGSHVLPRFATAAQDIFFVGNDTWFDRSADLRVLLNGGAPGGAPPDARYLNGAQPVPGITPAVWVKGSGTWLKQDDKAQTESSGRIYRYDLNRDLDVAHFQTGVDFGAIDVLSQGDMLIYGVLGGAILGDLDYNQIARQFDISGGEVGTYATYLRGGLFVDTLLKADFVEFDSNGALGVPGSFNSTAWGVRTDAGYRFGSFRRGLFIEPLATIAFNWVDVEDFTVGGNKAILHDESVIRGRLGLRLGTSTEVWSGTLMEPFVIGSVWGNLGSDTNRATLTSNGTTFHFQDDLDETWGVVSAGVNFFNFAANTTVFAKLDVIFGDETDGVSGKGGLRVSW
jgi:autotransporter family porin